MRFRPAVELAAWLLAVRGPPMHRHLQSVLRQRAARTLHRGHRDSHRSGDVPVLHSSLRVVFVGAQQDLRMMPFGHRRLARDDSLQLFALFFTQLDSVFLFGHPLLSLLFAHPSTFLD